MKTYEEVLQELELFTRFPDDEYEELLRQKFVYEKKLKIRFHNCKVYNDGPFILTSASE